MKNKILAILIILTFPISMTLIILWQNREEYINGINECLEELNK